jgi:hypothetical protein
MAAFHHPISAIGGSQLIGFYLSEPILGCCWQNCIRGWTVINGSKFDEANMITGLACRHAVVICWL